MMLLLRALVILGAVLAVLSCGFASSLAPTDSQTAEGGDAPEDCNRMTLSNALVTAPTAGGAVAASNGTGLCL